MNLYAIDPGSSSGALVFWCPNCIPKLQAKNMPKTFLDILKELQEVEQFVEDTVMENVGGTRPGNAAKGARTFAEHVGALKMGLLAAGITHRFVGPRRWLVDLFGESYPKGGASDEVRKRKHFIYDKMQQLYPTEKFTLRQADAVAMMHWLRKLKGDVS